MKTFVYKMCLYGNNIWNSQFILEILYFHNVNYNKNATKNPLFFIYFHPKKKSHDKILWWIKLNERENLRVCIISSTHTDSFYFNSTSLTRLLSKIWASTIYTLKKMKRNEQGIEENEKKTPLTKIDDEE